MVRDADEAQREVGIAYPVSPLETLLDGAYNLSLAEAELISQLCKNGATRKRIGSTRQSSRPRLSVDARDSCATCQLLSSWYFSLNLIRERRCCFEGYSLALIYRNERSGRKPEIPSSRCHLGGADEN